MPEEDCKELPREVPPAAKVIENNSIVDDILTAVDSPEEALNLVTQLTEICDSINLKIRKFASNHPEVMATSTTARKLLTSN